MKHIQPLNEALQQRALELILRGLKQTGDNKEAYFYIEEDLYGNEATEVAAFLGWLEETGKSIGSGNAKTVYAEFKKAIKPSDFEKHNVMNMKTKHEDKRNERMLADQEFKKGDKVYVQSDVTSSFVTKHEIISTDPKNNTITIKLSDPYKAK